MANGQGPRSMVQRPNLDLVSKLDHHIHVAIKHGCRGADGVAQIALPQQGAAEHVEGVQIARIVANKGAAVCDCRTSTR